MLRKILVLFFLAAPGISSARDLCDDLWFTRNLVFDKAGYCFSTPLGQAVFDNSDCTSKSPQLPRDAQAFVAWVKLQEAEWECALDTERTHITTELLPIRRLIRHRVAPSGYESACIGWHGDAFPLFDGHSGKMLPIGQVEPADIIIWEFNMLDPTPNGWDFLTVQRDGAMISMGWSNMRIEPAMCDGMAG